MENKKILSKTAPIILLAFIFSVLISCTFTEDPQALEPAPETEEATAAEAPQEPEEIIPVRLWIDELIPESFQGVIVQEARKTFGMRETEEVDIDFDIGVTISPPGRSHEIFWVLAPVVPFYTYNDYVDIDDLKAYWDGSRDALDYITNDHSEPGFVLSREVFDILEEIWGESNNQDITILDDNDVHSYMIENEDSFSIVPFDAIAREYKVLEIGGMSIFDRDLDIMDWPLAAGIEVAGDDPGKVESLVANIKSTLPSNRNLDRLTTLNMTGVTAIVRQIARRIEADGSITSPGEKIAETLRDADITHISNEIPFVEGCTTDARPQGLVFCSNADNIELLRYVGTDVIELTGNHMIDKGHDWMHFTLDLYEEEGWQYFGGGRDLEDSYKPAIFDINGNRIALLGANTFGPDWNWATENTPGSARINMWHEEQYEQDMQKFEQIIKDLKDQGYIVIFTFQHEEIYQYSPNENHIADFRRMIDAGADIVSGSQSHHPMGFEFRGDGFIKYGLGNLFFGQQLQILGNNPGLIPKHIFYNGRHINTVIATTMLNDFSQPRLTTPEERSRLLENIFDASIREEW